MTAKSIILCSDGTGNSGGKGCGTNVWRIYNGVDTHAHRNGDGVREQVAFYDDGVGTERFKAVRLLTGAVGFGLGHNVRELYTRLVKNYNPGDHIYLFGFSRGAFTVRTLAGLITECGVLDRYHSEAKTDDDLKDCVEKAYRAYRYKYDAWLTKPFTMLFRWLGLAQTAEEFRKKYGVSVEPDSYSDEDYPHISAEAIKASSELKTCDGDDVHSSQSRRVVEHPKDIPIRFMGVWDTVDAVGLPSDLLTNLINRVFYRFKFDHQTLSERVNKACHALAIDEERRSFTPLLFNEKRIRKEGPSKRQEKKGDYAPDEEMRIEQVWFAGVHSNVGGGYPKQQMAKVTQRWMMQKAKDCDLRFNAGEEQGIKEESNVHGKLYDSRSGLGIYYISRPRDIDKLTADYCVARANVHVSVFQRIALGTDDYAPGNLPRDVTIMSTDDTNAGEDRHALAKLSKQIDASYNGGGKLLDRVKKHNLTRYVSHVVAISIAFYVFVCTQSWLQKGIYNVTGLSVGDWCPSFSFPLVNHVFGPFSPFTHATIVVTVVGLALYAMDFRIRKYMSGHFSCFWRNVEPMQIPWWRNADAGSQKHMNS
ncbi:MAG: DUF2235 domain-containing protein [Pseudomonadales bacterium]